MNHDTPLAEMGFFSAGGILSDFLRSEELSDLIHAREIESEEIAKEAVNLQDAGVAIIIPEEYTRRAFDPEGKVDITIYQDPTLTTIGQTVPDFSTVSIDGDTISIKDFRGKIVLLNFFATW